MGERWRENFEREKLAGNRGWKKNKKYIGWGLQREGQREEKQRKEIKDNKGKKQIKKNENKKCLLYIRHLASMSITN